MMDDIIMHCRVYVGLPDANKGENDNKLKKFKLVVGGVTRTIQLKTIFWNFNEFRISSANIVSTGFLWGAFTLGRENTSMGKNSGRKHGEKSDRALKSKMVPKKCVLDVAFSEEDGGDELRYPENLKAVKVAAASGDYDNVSVDTDDEEEDSVSDHENEGNKGKKLRKDSPDFPNETKREKTLTSLQRALLSGTDSVSTASQIEFLNGLSYAHPQKQKEKFTEVERQLKKDEAAERRRIQNEKAAQESEAEAIRKKRENQLDKHQEETAQAEAIRKKRENQLDKHQEETAQEKAANAKVLAPSTIRTVIGPTGTTVEFAEDIGLPHIFDPKPTCYPPPREKCAGPSCINVYKYRDSKSNLPLCSLQCYKAVHAMMLSESSI